MQELSDRRARLTYLEDDVLLDLLQLRAMPPLANTERVLELVIQMDWAPTQVSQETKLLLEFYTGSKYCSLVI